MWFTERIGDISQSTQRFILIKIKTTVHVESPLFFFQHSAETRMSSPHLQIYFMKGGEIRASVVFFFFFSKSENVS